MGRLSTIPLFHFQRFSARQMRACNYAPSVRAFPGAEHVKNQQHTFQVYATEIY